MAAKFERFGAIMDKKFYVCKGCHKAVEYGNDGAVRDVDGNIFCSKDCAIGSLVDAWESIAEFESTEENGYLVSIVGDGFFSNRYYIIFEDCNLDLDDEDYRKFVKFNDIKESVERYAKRHLEESFNEGFSIATIDSIEPKAGKVGILGKTFNLYYMRFILKYFGVESMGFEVKLDEIGQLFIRAGQHKAILMAIQAVA